MEIFEKDCINLSNSTSKQTCLQKNGDAKHQIQWSIVKGWAANWARVQNRYKSIQRSAHKLSNKIYFD